ncbi:MAG: preprotein translocase subunit TatA [Nitrospirae bacterium RIFCSPLOWO2_02_42_7]|nr:MAG: preprotein translocase subunit TatA [Nitrospirae bacterium RIFCSPLOWO2_02_42_7]
MFGLGMSELLIILAIVVIICGVGKLPQIGEGLGKAISGFKRGVSETNKIEDMRQRSDKKDD